MYKTPEEAGISSKKIKEYIEVLEEKQLSTHDVILMRGNDIIFEKYWEPFHEHFLHRMYSVTKSFVAIAVGFLEQDHLIDLDDKIGKYFPDEIKNQKDENMQNQTIRHMLMMSTAKVPQNWFEKRTDDRVRLYFENDDPVSRPSGTIFQYDSSGSFVLCALVERITEMSFIDYMREKLFDKIGISKEAYCLKCPGGHSWGDSALLCIARDLLKFARFVMNKGNWDGEQILNEKYLTEATGKMIDNNVSGFETFNSQGYGYQIWRTYQNSFSFNGMGCQYAICVPDKDLILVYNGDNQGKDHTKHIIFDKFFEIIVDSVQDKALPDDPKAQKELADYTADLKLAAAVGERKSAFADEINGVTYKMNCNPMGITRIRLVFDGDKGRLEYTNDQGDKTLYFGICKNEFGIFPQEGYSDEVGSVSTKNMFYQCAASAAWIEPQKLFIKVQIIDKYFGTLNINLGFRQNKVGVFMNKCAEGFLSEYEGYATGIKE